MLTKVKEFKLNRMCTHVSKKTLMVCEKKTGAEQNIHERYKARSEYGVKNC